MFHERSETESPGIRDVNMTPLIDVSLVLVVILLLATPLAFEGEGLRTLDITAQVDAGAQRVALSEATIGLDAIEARAGLTAVLSGAVPKIEGRLDLGAVDLDPYLPPAGAQEGDGQDAGRAEPSGWSDEPIPIPTLDMAELDFQLGLDKLLVRDIQLDRTVLGLGLKDAVLRADLEEFGLYGGSGTVPWRSRRSPNV